MKDYCEDVAFEKNNTKYACSCGAIATCRAESSRE